MHRGLRLAMVGTLLVAGCGAADPPPPSARPSAIASPAASPPASSSPSASVTATASAPISAAPSVAPTVGDGEAWIVFQGVPLGLSFIRPDGSGNHVILGPPGEQVHPDWSPDGSRIAYVQATDTTFEVWITDPLGTNPAALVTDYPAELSGLYWDNPAWSPDGTQIATVGYSGNPGAGLPTGSVLATTQ